MLEAMLKAVNAQYPYYQYFPLMPGFAPLQLIIAQPSN
jgi:hypothetical protein